MTVGKRQARWKKASRLGRYPPIYVLRRSHSSALSKQEALT
jgi:hypothetical protein